ncbi:hypothetical protein J2858_001301 [Neorhizobium galegae]|uniref:DUF3095 domain-containing protein n=1 Tax=Neorhizobium galegae TaxID=399 RepID=UPI001AE37AB9|nr:DUF3095 domain-containing protein [Neorhizobium galegae]MBP2548408.1 hypothetical protein [Neorhizobium galegae]
MTDAFYQSLPIFTRFEGVADARNYQPLPQDWVLAVADIVGSTKAIAEGRYKQVNMAGASVISAVLNALGHEDYPFSFGGDGAMVALPAHHAEAARAALAAVRAWAGRELALDMRVALVPIADIRQAGLDVAVARFAASPLVSYAMFTGGGASWAERQMKAGRYTIEAKTEAPPDLTGLSCRWSPMQAHNGEIVSIIAQPTSPATMAQFEALVSAIIQVTAEQSRNGHPVPEEGPQLAFSTDGIKAETLAFAPRQRLLQSLRIRLLVALTALLHRLNIPLGRFDTRRYTRDVAANSDFRKFDDGLKMTVDVDEPHRLRIEKLLAEAEETGVCRYGIHRQDSALMTCFVLSPMTRNHMHFVDGGGGGYAIAASKLSGKRSTDPV